MGLGRRTLLLAGGLAAASPGAASAASESGLRAGAAKVEITPPASSLPPGMSIHDPLFVRALVLRNAGACAVLVGVEQGAVQAEVTDRAVAGAAKATGCDPRQFVVSATHTHSGSSQGLFGG